MTELNASKHRLLNRLFSDESLLQADDFPESQRDAYRFAARARSFLRPFDYMLSFVTNYRILDHYFRLPKTTIELAWDELDASVHEYNDVLNTLKNDEELTYKHTLTHKHKIKDKEVTSELPAELLSSILSYLEPEQLIEITHDHALNRSFQTRTALNNALPLLKENGFQEHVFIYINPLALFWNKGLQEALKQVLDEGFHISLFKTINPERLLKTPRFDVPNMPDTAEEGADTAFNTKTWWHNKQGRGDYIDYLSPVIFPDSCRAIRGKDGHKRPFISVLNGDNQAVTFFQRYTDEEHTWVTGTNHGDGELSTMGIGHLNLMQTKEGIQQRGNYYEPGSSQVVCQSFSKYQEWKNLFLGYINASCPQPDGEQCSLEMLTSISDSLMLIVEDPYPFVDREEYPDLDLPHTRPDLA